MGYNFRVTDKVEGITALLESDKTGGVTPTIYGMIWDYAIEKLNMDDIEIGNYLAIDKTKSVFKVHPQVVIKVDPTIEEGSSSDKAKRFIEALKNKIGVGNYPDALDRIGRGKGNVALGSIFDVGAGSGGSAISTTDQENLQVLALAWYQACNTLGTSTSADAFNAFVQVAADSTWKDANEYRRVGSMVAGSTRFKLKSSTGSSGWVTPKLGTANLVGISKVCKIAHKDKDWITAAWRNADKLHSSHSQINYKSSDLYIFSHVEATGYKWFKEKYNELRKKLVPNPLGINVMMEGNKWNPADALAVNINSFRKKENVSKATTIINGNTTDHLAALAAYNNLILQWFEEGNIIPISLKKSSKSPKIKFMNYSGVGGTDKMQDSVMETMSDISKAKTEKQKLDIMNKLVIIDKVEYNVNILKTKVYFSLDLNRNGTPDPSEQFYFDARPFGGDKVEDIKVQLLPAKGASAALGRAEFSVMEELIKSYNSTHFNFLKKKRQDAVNYILKKRGMKESEIRGPFRATLEQFKKIDLFTRFGKGSSNFSDTLIGKLYNNQVGKEILAEYIGSISNTKGSHIDSLSGKLDNSKHYRVKLQSNEFASLFDISDVSEIIRKKILLTIFFYISSRGIYAFLDDSDVEKIKNSAIRSSPFIILGG
jgi:hypothetical protein